MKNAGIVIGIVSLISVAVVGFLLHVSLKSYTDSQVADALSDQNGIRAAQTGLRDSLDEIEKRLADLELKAKVGPESYSLEISDLETAVKDLKKRLDDLEKGGVASASPSESGESGTGRGKTELGKAIDDALDSMKEEGDENLTDEERSAKAMRNLMRQGAKEMMKYAKKQQEQRLERAVKKLSLSAGQEEQMKTLIEETMTKAQEIMDKGFGEEGMGNMREEMQKLREDTEAQAKDILTEEQYKEWEKSDPMRGGGLGRGMWGGRRRGPSGDGDRQSE